MSKHAHQIAWFIGLWLVSVASVATAAYALRGLLKLISTVP